jgi:uncharacterized protein (TIGR01244 family)
MIFERLSDAVLISGQIGTADIADAAAAGVTVIVNNRPDGEEPGQPPGAGIEAAARAAGLAYRHIPVAGGFAPDLVAAMAAAMDEGRILAFCKSGTRSTWLWALAARSRGEDPASIIARAAAAGYDLAPLEPYLS